jgi:HTH-type transcriptional regulator/antitoxin HigA
MATTLEIAKSLLSPPGDTIQEHIDFIGMSQAELAERMGKHKEKINDIIKGRDPITTVTAFQLENVLGVPASFWINREKTYRKELYEIKQREQLESGMDWMRSFPINEMRKMGWLPNSAEKHVLVDSLLKFFGVASPIEWNYIYVKEEISVAFRVSLAHTKSPHAISAWLRKGELQAKEMEIEEFDKKKFKEAVEEIKKLGLFHAQKLHSTIAKLVCQKWGGGCVHTELTQSTNKWSYSLVS